MFERKRTFQIFLVCFLTHCLAGDLSVLPHRPKNGQKIGKGYGAKASKGAVDCRHYRAAVDFHFDESIYGSVVTKSSIQLRYVTHDFEIPRDGFLLFSPNKKDQPKVSCINWNWLRRADFTVETDQDYVWNVWMRGAEL